MILTSTLSLWIQNTSSASMMLPICIALVKQLIKHDKMYHEHQNLDNKDTEKGREQEKLNKNPPILKINNLTALTATTEFQSGIEHLFIFIYTYWIIINCVIKY